MTLEEQLFALMDQHGLNYIGIGVYTLPDGTRFLGGAAHGGNICAHGDSHHNPSAIDALNAALTNYEAKRLKITPVVELAAMGEAA